MLNLLYTATNAMTVNKRTCYQFYYGVNMIIDNPISVHVRVRTQQESPLRGFEGFKFPSRGCTLPSSALTTRSCAWLFPIPPLNYSHPAGFNPPLVKLHARLIPRRRSLLVHTAESLMHLRSKSLFLLLMG